MRHFDCHEVEQMDRPQPASRELENTLRQLESMNRKFGGHRYLLRFLEKRFRPGRSFRVLDLATGAGDFPRAMTNWARGRDIELLVDAVDSSEAIVALAEKFSRGYDEIRYFQSDALTFQSHEYYDLVHCSLSLHHFSAAEAVKFLEHCRELSREFVLITDLERNVFTRIAVHLVNTLFGHREMTVNDGDISARRAFSFTEFSAVAKGAGWKNFGHERFLFCRQALWIPGRDKGLG
jgi:2-polyprenyl-3-methyl-5-hydroxy-6-metoxy-1,4-benzoquinol methylase